ncbi:hypothetical protein NM208_g5167 [Fusarium decemcellulare]|uniref:Uncharacterized protein n=1 Tax=Fusarium decemcellulare TaxID=57161 RepID=A0ACC1SIB6_9HYPO|nr:hypothetical protein NM208_g5167 [Fusarium decemcellulare]
MVKTAVEAFGRIDIVINNAGWADVSKFDQTSDAQLWNMLKVHVGGSWNVTQAAWPHFKKQKYGRIIMTTSTLMLGGVGQAIYGAAKLALVGLVKSIALEGKDDNILINSLAPSAYTPGVAATVQNEQVKAVVEKYMPPSEVAPMVLWLVHDDNRTTGEAFGAAGRLLSRIFVAQTDGF